MPTMTVDLQEGFEKDRVSILVDDKQIFERDEIKTRPEIGFAARARFKLTGGTHQISVRLPDRDLEGSIDVDPESASFLGVSLDAGQLKLEPRATTFGYL